MRKIYRSVKNAPYVVLVMFINLVSEFRIIATIGYYTVFMNLASLQGSDPFIGFFLGCLVAFPGTVLFTFGMQCVGRRFVFCLSMFICALCGFGIILITLSGQFLNFFE